MTGKADLKAKNKAKKRVKEEDEAYTCSKGAKVKKERDPNEPKKPLCAFFFFLNERRLTLKEEQPELLMGKQTKIMTIEWKSMDEKKKKKYLDLQEKDRQRY